MCVGIRPSMAGCIFHCAAPETLMPDAQPVPSPWHGSAEALLQRMQRNGQATKSDTALTAWAPDIYACHYVAPSTHAHCKESTQERACRSSVPSAPGSSTSRRVWLGSGPSGRRGGGRRRRCITC